MPQQHCILSRITTRVFTLIELQAVVGGRVLEDGSLYYSPQHHSQGIGYSFMDGHAQFSRVNSARVLAGVYPDIDYTHRTFWGRYNDGTYVSGYYKYQP